MKAGAALLPSAAALSLAAAHLRQACLFLMRISGAFTLRRCHQALRAATLRLRPPPGDAPRLAVQTILAVLISYGAALLLRLPDPSWAVFSALYVIQGSLDGTLVAARDRVLGAVLGAGLALACIFLIGVGGWHTLLSLAVGIGIMSLIAGAASRFSYGLVPVAILIVAPGIEVIEDALLKIAAILLGSSAGAAASLLVLPRRAQHAAERHLAEALESCGALLSACTARLLAEEEVELQPAHEELTRALSDASAMARQACFQAGGEGRDSPAALLSRIERLWYSLALMDRLSSRPLPEPLRGTLAPPVRHATEEARQWLHQVSGAVTGAGPRPSPRGLHEAVERLSGEIEALQAENSLKDMSRGEVEVVFGLSLAWQQVGHNLRDLLPAPDA